MMARIVPVLAFLSACGPVTAPLDTDAPTGDDAPIADAPLDGCVPHASVHVTFKVTQVIGNGTSPLDPINQHENEYTFDVSDWTDIMGIDNNPPIGAAAKSAVKANQSFTMTYAGTDKMLLDSELGQFLSVGGAFMQSQLELSDDKSLFFYVLPADPSVHPYMDTRCNNAPFTVTNGFPDLASFTAMFCSVTFFDFRDTTQRNLVAPQNATLTFDYAPCP